MKRIVARLVAGAAILAVGLAIAAWAVLRASLPDLDGEFIVDGIEGRVTIEADVALATAQETA